MNFLRLLALFFVGATTVGCTTSHGQTYRSSQWQAGQSLGKVLVILPQYPSDPARAKPQREEKILLALRSALEKMPATTVSGMITSESPQPMSESQAIQAARKAGVQTVCLVTIGEFGGRYLLTLLPPGWDSRTTVQYAMRIIDVDTGALLVDSVRERTSGGYLAIKSATYPEDFQADLSGVLLSQ